MDPSYLDFLYRLGEFNIKQALDTIRSMLELLDNPHNHPRIIHLAGTNGKGSTLKTLESLLLASGYTTGSTISPHLTSINERYRINGVAIGENSLNSAFRKVCLACDINLDLSSPTSRDGKLCPTFFEFSLAMAFVLFKAANVDYILLETGLGGRLDATNIIEKPLACIITRIAFDHQEYLGNSLGEIAKEKLGILKANSPVFVAPQEKSVAQDIESHCESNGYNCFLSKISFFRETVSESERFVFDCVPGTESIEWVVSESEIGLPGAHQKDNILTALASYLYLVPEISRLKRSGVVKVLKNLEWEGRLQYLGRQDDILLDGAHNESGMKALMAYLSALSSEKRVLMAIGWMKNKNLFKAFEQFCCDNISFIPMEMNSERSEKAITISRTLQDSKKSVLPIMNCAELVTAKLDGSLPANDLLVVAGSLYLVGEFLSLWRSAEVAG